MRHLLKQSLIWVLLVLLPLSVIAEDMMIENFEMQPETRWRFFTDDVMGGVSTGQVAFREEDGQTYARMTGDVSTENNGGFIQMRMDLPEGAPEGTTGVRLIVRGNDQQYSAPLAAQHGVEGYASFSQSSTNGTRLVSPADIKVPLRRAIADRQVSGIAGARRERVTHDGNCPRLRERVPVVRLNKTGQEYQKK